MFAKLRDIWTSSGERYQSRRAQRAEIKKNRDEGGDWQRVENADRLRTRLQRKGYAPELATSLVSEAKLDPRIGNVLLERIIEDSELMNISFLTVGARIAKGVSRIEIRSSSGRALGHGTGFLVSSDLMMTNNHVLGDVAEAATSVAQFDYFERLDGSGIKVVNHRFEPGRFFKTNRTLDFTLVAVAAQSEDGQPLSTRPGNSLIRESGKALIGEPVNIIQHPRGETMKVALRMNEIVDRLDNFLHYVTDTERGSSGSQVCNDRWELAALHHSGVPSTNANGQILLKDGTVWNGDRQTVDQIHWVANEGVRISQIVKFLDGLALSPEERKLYDECFQGSAVQDHETLSSDDFAVKNGYPAQRTEPDGSVSWYFRVNFGPLGSGSEEKPCRPAPQTTDSRVTRTGSQTTTPGGGDEALARAQELIERFRPDLPYYNLDNDLRDVETYYQGVDFTKGKAAVFNALRKLLKKTHTTALSYKTARLKHLYPWVDLRESLELRNVYSGTALDPAEVMAQELERFELARPGFLAEFNSVAVEIDNDGDELDMLESALEAALPFNCEHVVPQSWFDKRQPMKADLHHLFTCEPKCNSFRGNIPYFDFAPLLSETPEVDKEVVREKCGQRLGDKFEPEFNHSAVARATLYFLLRYPKEIGDEARELQLDRLGTLIAWHKANTPNRYERHRNAAIFAVQGNRNPLIDFPEHVDDIDFRKGFE